MKRIYCLARSQGGEGKGEGRGEDGGEGTRGGVNSFPPPKRERLEPFLRLEWPSRGRGLSLGGQRAGSVESTDGRRRNSFTPSERAFLTRQWVWQVQGEEWVGNQTRRQQEKV